MRTWTGSSSMTARTPGRPAGIRGWGSPSGRGADLVAHDAGINGSAAAAEEAAIQAVDDDDYDIRCGD